MEKKKVLIYTDCHLYGGSERLMSFLLKNKKIAEEFQLIFAFRNHREYKKELLQDFENLNIHVQMHPLRVLSNGTIFYTVNNSKLPHFIKSIIKVPFFLLQKAGLYFLYNFLCFYFFIKQVQPQIIHINNGGYPGAPACGHFAFAARFNALHSIIYQVNNIAFTTSNSISKFWDKKLNACIAYFITASEKAKTALIDNRHFNQEKIIKIANTVIPEKITLKRDDILKDLQWRQDSFLLVQVGFLTRRKGQLYLLRAIQKIKSENIQGLSEKIKLILVGNGEDEAMLQKYVEENNLANNVHFAGYRLDSANYINACDVFVLPSIANEDMPLSLLTAMSLGKAIVATKFAGIAEIIRDKENGLLMQPVTISLSEKLQQALVSLYMNPEEKIQIGKNACITFNNNYSEDNYGKKISNLYKLSLSQTL